FKPPREVIGEDTWAPTNGTRWLPSIETGVSAGVTTPIGEYSASPGVVSIPGCAQRLGRMLRLYIFGSLKYSKSEGTLFYTTCRYACNGSAAAREEAHEYSKMY